MLFNTLKLRPHIALPSRSCKLNDMRLTGIHDLEAMLTHSNVQHPHMLLPSPYIIRTVHMIPLTLYLTLLHHPAPSMRYLSFRCQHTYLLILDYITPPHQPLARDHSNFRVDDPRLLYPRLSSHHSRSLHGPLPHSLDEYVRHLVHIKQLPVFQRHSPLINLVIHVTLQLILQGAHGLHPWLIQVAKFFIFLLTFLHPS